MKLSVSLRDGIFIQRVKVLGHICAEMAYSDITLCA